MKLTLDGSGPVKTTLRGRSWPQRDPQPTGSFLPSVVELYFLSILCVGHFSKQFACVSPDRNTMRYVLCLVLISHMGKLRHRAVKQLSQGHNANTLQGWGSTRLTGRSTLPHLWSISGPRVEPPLEATWSKVVGTMPAFEAPSSSPFLCLSWAFSRGRIWGFCRIFIP